MRSYLQSHPWITFEATDVNRLEPRTWMLLGEAFSKCEHLAGTALSPDAAERLYEVALVKGARATTAIEGNTLTEEQVAGMLNGTFSAPESRAYQQREVSNVLDALQGIADRLTTGAPPPAAGAPDRAPRHPAPGCDDRSPLITKDLICEFNRRLLEGTEHTPDAVPGAVRDHSVAVADYRGPPARDCGYLLDRLAGWLESRVFASDDRETGFALAVARAVYAHLYVAWVHPFGDGNGRTARLLEFLILVRAGIPLPAAHLLSNHYNLTRGRYYRELAHASKTRNTGGFLAYAVQGFVDGLRDQISQVRAHQIEVAWINHVHTVMNRRPSTPAGDRQRSLVLAMPADEAVEKAELPLLTPELAALYATKGPRTLSRDLNRLRDYGLILKQNSSWKANLSAIEAFPPPTARSSTG